MDVARKLYPAILAHFSTKNLSNLDATNTQAPLLYERSGQHTSPHCQTAVFIGSSTSPGFTPKVYCKRSQHIQTPRDIHNFQRPKSRPLTARQIIGKAYRLPTPKGFWSRGLRTNCLTNSRRRNRFRYFTASGPFVVRRVHALLGQPK